MSRNTARAPGRAERRRGEAGESDDAVELRAVTKSYGDTVAVDDLDLAVPDGELFAVLGPSGSGKTTVLRLIAGFERPTSGRVLLSGADVTNVSPNRRDVNTVFQNYALFPHMTVQQNVEYGLKVRGVGRRERRQRAGEMLELVHLSHRSNTSPVKLSGGQQQRIALARALAVKPRVLLLDEPLGALDLKLRQQMQVELRAIQRDVGITFVFVTHDQDEALTLCDRLAVFNHGRIEQAGTARDVYTRPANRFVADFVGTSNILESESAQHVLGRPGTFTIRPECIEVIPDGQDPPSLGRSAVASVGEVVYAGAVTRVLADLGDDVALNCLLLNSSRVGMKSLARGDRITLWWRDDAVHQVDSHC